MKNLLLTRDAFREGVFARDGHRCVFCSKSAADAHHILERRLWTDGGYYLNNGASVCVVFPKQGRYKELRFYEVDVRNLEVATDNVEQED